jgi:hypothetical protein
LPIDKEKNMPPNFPTNTEEQLEWLYEEMRYMTAYQVLMEEYPGQENKAVKNQVQETLHNVDLYMDMLGREIRKINEKTDEVEQKTDELVKLTTATCLKAFGWREAIRAGWNRAELVESIRRMDGDESLSRLAERDLPDKPVFLGPLSPEKQKVITCAMVADWLTGDDSDEAKKIDLLRDLDDLTPANAGILGVQSDGKIGP